MKKRFTIKDLNALLIPVRFKKNGGISKGKGEKGFYADLTDNEAARKYILRRSKKREVIRVPCNSVFNFPLPENA